MGIAIILIIGLIIGLAMEKLIGKQKDITTGANIIITMIGSGIGAFIGRTIFELDSVMEIYLPSIIVMIVSAAIFNWIVNLVLKTDE